MRIKKAIVVLLVFTACSCITISKRERNIAGTYYSSCFLYGETELKLILGDDYSFEYQRALLDVEIKGKWSIVGNKLILKSKSFLPDAFPEGAPEIKYTDHDIDDIYLIRDKKLLPNKEGEFSKNCVLQRR